MRVASSNTEIKIDNERAWDKWRTSSQIPGGFDRKVYLHPTSECVLYLRGAVGSRVETHFVPLTPYALSSP